MNKNYNNEKQANESLTSLTCYFFEVSDYSDPDISVSVGTGSAQQLMTSLIAYLCEVVRRTRDDAPSIFQDLPQPGVPDPPSGRRSNQNYFKLGTLLKNTVCYVRNDIVQNRLEHSVKQ